MAASSTVDPNHPAPIAVSPLDAARLIGVSRASIYNYLTSGRLPSFRIGHARRIPVAALEALAASANTEYDGTKANRGR